MRSVRVRPGAPDLPRLGRNARRDRRPGDRRGTADCNRLRAAHARLGGRRRFRGLLLLNSRTRRRQRRIRERDRLGFGARQGRRRVQGGGPARQQEGRGRRARAARVHLRRHFRNHRGGLLGRGEHDIPLDQVAHAGIALGVRGAAEHDGNDVPPVAADRRDQVVAGGLGVAGLDAVAALDLGQEAVVIVHLGIAVAEARRREVAVIDREALLDGASQQGLVARRGDLLVSGQSGGVYIDGARHAERLRLAGHQLGELFFAAAQRFGHDHCGIVRRLGDEPLDRILDGEGLVGLEAELGRVLGRGIGRDRQARVELDVAGLELLEQQIERHDLGERRRMARLVRAIGVQHGPGIGVDHDVGIGRPIVGAMDGAMRSLLRRSRLRRACVRPLCAGSDSG